MLTATEMLFKQYKDYDKTDCDYNDLIQLALIEQLVNINENIFYIQSILQTKLC
jgi:hypothetical protein